MKENVRNDVFRPTTIQLSNYAKEKLDKFKRQKESYEDAILRLLDFVDKILIEVDRIKGGE